jgi:outer membrane protein OmpA-like peptidoglycan-associated protein
MLAIRFSSALVLGLALTCAVHPAPCLAQGSEPSVDAMGCPNLTAFPKLAASVVVSCEKGDSVEVAMPLKPDDRGVTREKAVRGVYEFREYQIPQADQQERAFDNLMQLAPMAGFTVKYAEAPSTFTARNGDTWVLVKVSGEYYDVKSVRVKEAPWTPLFKNAQEISRELETDRRAAIYGIIFSPDNQAVQPESYKILFEIWTYLKANPALTLEVESHKVSNIGTAETDQEITRKRAQAMADWLQERGIAAGRVLPKEIGRTKPVTENDTPLEVQKNERIELVKPAP